MIHTAKFIEIEDKFINLNEVIYVEPSDVDKNNFTDIITYYGCITVAKPYNEVKRKVAASLYNNMPI